MLCNGKKTVLYVGGRSLREENLERLGGIAEKTAADIMCVTFPARLQRGAGRVPVQRLPYFAEDASAALAPYEQMIIVGTRAPVSFFAYPGKASWLAPANCELHTLAASSQDIDAVLTRLADSLGATPHTSTRTVRASRPVAGGALNATAIGRIINAAMPANTIVSDEAATCGLGIYPELESAAPHDWLTLTGGAIGQGLPLALGAALACPERKVLALQADGSAMYTIQTLWSMAREDVDVTVVLLNNRSYAVLNIELARVGAEAPTPKTLSMLDLSNPNMSFEQMAASMGIPSSRATTTEEFETQFAQAMSQRGPRFIEAMV
jgi:acetolactate synthase-1/2/3 large subunit